MFFWGHGVDSDANLRQSLPTRCMYKRLSFPTEAVDLTMHAVSFPVQTIACSNNTILACKRPSCRSTLILLRYLLKLSCRTLTYWRIKIKLAQMHRGITI